MYYNIIIFCVCIDVCILFVVHVEMMVYLSEVSSGPLHQLLRDNVVLLLIRLCTCIYNVQ